MGSNQALTAVSTSSIQDVIVIESQKLSGVQAGMPHSVCLVYELSLNI